VRDSGEGCQLLDRRRPAVRAEAFFEVTAERNGIAAPLSYAEARLPIHAQQSDCSGVGEVRASTARSTPRCSAGAAAAQRLAPLAEEAERCGRDCVPRPRDGPNWAFAGRAQRSTPFEGMFTPARYSHFELRSGAHAHRLKWNAALAGLMGGVRRTRDRTLPTMSKANAIVVARVHSQPKLLLVRLSAIFQLVRKWKGVIGHSSTIIPKLGVLELDRGPTEGTQISRCT